MRKWVLLMVTIVILTVFAGCLGGGDEGGTRSPQMVTAKGTTGAEGSVAAEQSTEPVPVSETVNIPIPEGNITGVSFVITVEDGDDGTNADEVSGDLEGAGGFNNTLPNGQTPYKATVDLKAKEGQELPSSWTITLNVVCHPSDDTWPGPLIISVNPDNGFSYNVTVNYQYLTPAK